MQRKAFSCKAEDRKGTYWRFYTIPPLTASTERSYNVQLKKAADITGKHLISSI